LEIAMRFWFLLLLACAACHSERAPEPAQRAKAEPSPKVHYQISEIPTFAVALDREPQPFPYPARGLRFQMTSTSSERLSLYKPIGQARFGPDQQLYVSFPELNTVARFSNPKWDIQ